MKPSDQLRTVGACSEACRWTDKYDNAQECWNACQRGDWMLWLLGKLSDQPGSQSRKAVVLCACECARLAIPQFEISHPDDKRPRMALETAERHCAGEASLKEVRAAATAYAADAAYAYAYAAACAASASDAACAASNAAYAASNAAYADARAKRLAECAAIVRKHFPTAPTIK